MNAEILIKYEMSSEELFIWNVFCEKIKLQCSMMQMPSICKEIIDKKLMIREPFFGNRAFRGELRSLVTMINVLFVCHGIRSILSLKC